MRCEWRAPQCYPLIVVAFCFRTVRVPHSDGPRAGPRRWSSPCLQNVLRTINYFGFLPAYTRTNTETHSSARALVSPREHVHCHEQPAFPLEKERIDFPETTLVHFWQFRRDDKGQRGTSFRSKRCLRQPSSALLIRSLHLQREICYRKPHVDSLLVQILVLAIPLRGV